MSCNPFLLVVVMMLYLYSCVMLQRSLLAENYLGSPSYSVTNSYGSHLTWASGFLHCQVRVRIGSRCAKDTMWTPGQIDVIGIMRMSIGCHFNTG